MYARRHQLRAYASLNELLAEAAVEIVVNLTLPSAHADVTEQCLATGKHVYSEKPLALDSATARRLVMLARRRGVRLSCAPATFLGEAHQTAWKLIRSGCAGAIRVIYAEVNQGRIERYHPAPEPFFAVGPLWDVGVYPMTVLTAFFGPVRRVCGHGRVILPRRVAKDGHEFRVRTPEFVVALVEFAGGQTVRLTANFYVDRDTSKGGGSIEYHGDAGRIYTGDFQLFDAPVECAIGREGYRRVAPLRAPFHGVEYGRGVAELADAIREDRPHRASGEHAAHVVEVIEAIQHSVARAGRSVAVRSSFLPPTPMPWAM